MVPQFPRTERRTFIGGSDARIIMGDDEASLIHLWHEKRGEIGPEDLSGNLIVQLGIVTEALNRHWSNVFNIIMKGASHAPLQ
jgi:predicted phage-related endonuclease